MSSDGVSRTAIEVQALGKRFSLGERTPYKRLGESIVRAAKRPFRRSGPKKSREVLWALRDLSFTVQEGEIVGVVGSNGAGKTTLLRILAKITLPTEGRAAVYGRVGSLLEVGTGFHPELTGRENVLLNGSILGMSRREILEKYDEIVAFAQIPQFMETPVKHYSTGMRVRLAFSVAAHLEPEILFIDEVLSVGDAEFQERCLGKMEQVAGTGRTILFVSHNMKAVTNLCTRCIWIEGGRIKMDGEPHHVVESYLSRGDLSDGTWNHPDEQGCGQRAKISRIEVLGADGGTSGSVPFVEPIRFRVRHEVTEPIYGLRLRIDVKDTSGTTILTTSNRDTNRAPTTWEPGAYSHTFEIPGGLLRPGRYVLSARTKVKATTFDDHENCLTFDVLPIGASETRRGVITPWLPWKLEDGADRVRT